MGVRMLQFLCLNLILLLTESFHLSRFSSQLLTQTRFSLSHLRLTSNEFKNGMVLDIEGKPTQILEFMHVKPGKGAAFVRTKIRNLLTGTVMEKTFRAGEPVTQAEVEKLNVKFSYIDRGSYCFFDSTTYEEYRVPFEKVAQWKNLLVDGIPCMLSLWKNEVIDLTPPHSYTYTVVSMEVTSTVTATLDSGAKLIVPGFIKVGEKIVVQTQPIQYISRA
jgi:elongation factor P